MWYEGAVVKRRQQGQLLVVFEAVTVGLTGHSSSNAGRTAMGLPVIVAQCCSCYC